MISRNLLLLLLAVALPLALACGGNDDDDDMTNDDDIINDDDVLTDGPHLLLADDGAVELRDDETVLFRLKEVRTQSFDLEFQFFWAQHLFEQPGFSETPLTFVADGDAIALMNGDQSVGSIALATSEAGNIHLDLNIEPDAQQTGVNLLFDCATGDRFWGFGEQYNFIDMRGQQPEIFVGEQGIGRFEGPRIPPTGNLTVTYYPMPYFMDPEAGKGILFQTSAYSRFDVCATATDTWTWEVWEPHGASAAVFHADEPMGVIEQLSDEVGRNQQAPPEWAFSGAWLSAQNGTEAVDTRIKQALEADVAVSAVWTQDWVGQRDFGAGNFGLLYNWEWDEDHYPDLPAKIAEWDALGVRFLGYFNPWVLPEEQHWAEMAENGWLVKDTDGEPYVMPISTFQGGMIDVTHPGAREYFTQFADRATAMGQKGWMCDFGESLPFDAQVHQGTAPLVHNLYPNQWQALNRAALEAAYPDGDYVMFSRSGFTGNSEIAQILWAGDQEVTWEEGDGFPTVLAAGLTSGISGVQFFTHDTGGFSGGPRTKEILWRWTELGAFTPIMRTHDGLQKFTNHQFDSEPDTRAMFSRFSRIHQALLPYWLEVAGEAADTGRPMIRHTAFVDPDWEPAYDAHEQWMIGEDLLIAPVVTEGATEVEVHFPEGTWVHLLRDQTLEGRQTVTVEAPLSEPAAFVRAGALDDIVEQVREIQ